MPSYYHEIVLLHLQPAAVFSKKIQRRPRVSLCGGVFRCTLIVQLTTLCDNEAMRVRLIREDNTSKQAKYLQRD